mgnify:FL=1
MFIIAMFLCLLLAGWLTHILVCMYSEYHDEDETNKEDKNNNE